LRQPITNVEELKAWVLLGQPITQLLSILPFLLGFVIAGSASTPMHWGVFGTSMLAIVLISYIIRWAGEYWDYETDCINTEYNRLSGGTRVLPQGLLIRRQVIIAVDVLIALVILMGLVLFFYYKTGPYTIPLGAFGILCAYFYCAPPFRWSYRGLGEILIGVCYGWLTVNTAYYLQTGHFSLTPTLVSLPLAISIFLVILINEFPDETSDRISGKGNLVVRFGKEKMSVLYMALAIACSLSVLPGLFYGVPWRAGLLFILVLMLALWNIKDIQKLQKRAFDDAKSLERLCFQTAVLFFLINAIYFITFGIGGQ